MQRENNGMVSLSGCSYALAKDGGVVGSVGLLSYV